MKFLYPIAFGIASGFISFKLGYTPTELGFWVISAPFILTGGLLFAYSH